MSEICRTCLEIITETSEMCYLSDMEPNCELLTLGQKLAACLPELVVINGVLCWPCATALRCAYGFRQQCLDSEKRINNYLQTTNHNGYLDLKKVIQQRYGKEQSNMTADVVTSGTKMSNFHQPQNYSSAVAQNVADAQVTPAKVEVTTPPIVHQTLTLPGGSVVNKLQQNCSLGARAETPKNIVANYSQQVGSVCNLPIREAPSFQSSANLNVGTNIPQSPCTKNVPRNLEIKYMCNECSYHSLIPGELQNHLLTHKAEKLSPHGTSNSTYNDLLKQLSDEKTYVCTELKCSYKTAKISRFESHKRVHLALGANV